MNLNLPLVDSKTGCIYGINLLLCFVETLHIQRLYSFLSKIVFCCV